MLAMVLEKAEERGIDRVLITCDDDNLASVRVIEKNGGLETTSTLSPRSGKTVRRFWISLPPQV
jgi:predicted acetyltransferase